MIDLKALRETAKGMGWTCTAGNHPMSNSLHFASPDRIRYLDVYVNHAQTKVIDTWSSNGTVTRTIESCLEWLEKQR